MMCKMPVSLVVSTLFLLKNCIGDYYVWSSAATISGNEGAWDTYITYCISVQNPMHNSLQ